jgi:diguanylate cyclase (GGDEF)-like protein
MNEMRYQLELLKATNQKISTQEQMYRRICSTSNNAYLYYSFRKKELTTLGRWDTFFDFPVSEWKDVVKLFDVVKESYMLPLRDVLFLEKNGLEDAFLECATQDERQWLEFKTHIFYDENGEPNDKLITIRNITNIHNKTEELKYMAYYDTLTGLHNRNYFVHQLGIWLEKAKNENTIVSVINIDIDDFRKINDGMGIIVGDELVQQLGGYLHDLEEEHVLACHLDSDIYCMAIYDPSGTRSVEHIHKVIHNRIKAPFVLSGGQKLYITVSMGVAEYPEAASTPLELINSAEIVMFKGKAMGKNSIQYYDTPILMEFLQNIALENRLNEAISNSRFLLYYQPQYYTDTKKLRGVEALIRWSDTDGMMISPGVFIPVAEKNGSIVVIGKWVLEESFRQYTEWKKKYSYPLIMSVNVSAIQYNTDDFVDILFYLLKKYEVKPYEIELEITESVLIDNFVAVSEKLRRLRDYGIRISLDDFGTGFSSLSYLKKLPIDTLKIDKSFIDTVLTDSATRIITESIITMVKTLGFESIAEGVEEENQYDYLQVIGCDIIQGFLFGKPQTAEGIERLLQEAGE